MYKSKLKEAFRSLIDEIHYEVEKWRKTRPWVRWVWMPYAALAIAVIINWTIGWTKIFNFCLVLGVVTIIAVGLWRYRKLSAPPQQQRQPNGQSP